MTVLRSQRTKEVSSGLIQFHFGLKEAKFIQPRNCLDLKKKNHTALQSTKELPLNLELAPSSWVISVIISKKIPCFVFTEADYFFLSGETKTKILQRRKYKSFNGIVVQLFHYNLHPSIKNLYYKGKGYELLSLYFNRTEDPNAEQCPFLIDEDNVMKIRKAKKLSLLIWRSHRSTRISR
jgi:hypothetical protein